MMEQNTGPKADDLERLKQDFENGPLSQQEQEYLL